MKTKTKSSGSLLKGESLSLEEINKSLEERFVIATITENGPVVPEDSESYDNYDDAFINLFAEALEGMSNDKEFPQNFAKKVKNIYLEGDLRKMRNLMDTEPMANYWGKWIFSKSILETIRRI